MKLTRFTFLLCALAFLLLITSTSSLQLHSGYSSPSQGKSENEEKRLGEEEEEKALSKYLSMDYPRFRRRRPVHNKSLRP
ncbi:unnamed protein product [Eruca vesicaria subsp. sativa]|uniref:Uncharacterized protein n=1 Tax=Eruca vesicaria subsp. sativa TaxID=29727 RepID=A0ABC8LVV9_ERUVS|nr:unnamed protein product [Eruca vesicaria subsp. sativa]